LNPSDLILDPSPIETPALVFGRGFDPEVLFSGNFLVIGKF
jgi:hypothetical protein